MAAEKHKFKSYPGGRWPNSCVRCGKNEDDSVHEVEDPVAHEDDSVIVITRCGTCGTFAPQVLGYGAKIVSMPCAHHDWREVRYANVSL